MYFNVDCELFNVCIPGKLSFELATWGLLYGFVAHITVTNVQIKPIKAQLNLSTHLIQVW